MKTIKYVSAVIIMSVAAVSIGASAQEDRKNDLQVIMQSLLQASNDIVEGMMLSDTAIVSKAAEKIARHPQVGPDSKTKILKGLGYEMQSFKALDTYVHDQAVKIKKASQENDMELVRKEYTALIKGCVSCHTQYKSRVSDILNE